MTDAPLTPDEADAALAAEYVIGLQDAAERAMTAVRVQNDPGFARLVTAWEIRLQTLNDEYAPVRAPKLLPTIEARLFPRPGRRGLGGALWQWLAGAGVGALLVLGTLATLAPPSAGVVAVLATANAQLAFEVRYSSNKLAVTRVAGPPAVAGRVHEIWLIVPGAAPVSLGVVVDAPLVIDYPRPPEGWALAVSIEPEGGSTYGTPTGPVILSAVIGADA